MRLAGRRRGWSLPLTSGTSTPAPCDTPQGHLVLHSPFPPSQPLLTKASLFSSPPPKLCRPSPPSPRRILPHMPPAGTWVRPTLVLAQDG